MTQQEEQYIQFDREKFLHVVHYICSQCEPDELGNVKLHKILYFADMINFVWHGQPLTGVDYIKQQFGPVARHLSWGLKKLEENGKIQTYTKDYYGFPKLHIASLRKPELDLISDEQVHLIDSVVRFVKGKSSKEVSELSHTRPWELAEMGEVVPYFTAYGLMPSIVSDADREWAQQESEAIFG